MALKRKRPSSEDVKGLLLEGNFGSRSDEPLPLTDPLSTTQMVLKLSDIKPYDKNPRREKNPAYEDIKASIRSKKQLNNNFNVTRRPGDEKFMVESGGNTRLAILNELYQETGDEAFNTVHCLFVPWKSEAAVLSAHLIENEMRGDMTLIDKAYAVRELKRELEAESGKALSDREFTRVASGIGYKISPKHFRRFSYALKLDQMIPQALRSGLGGNKIEEIKKTEKAYADFFRDRPELSEDLFESTFMAVMSENDTDEFWSLADVRRELDERLAELTGIRENLLRIEVDAILFERPGEVDFSAPPSRTEETGDQREFRPVLPDSGRDIPPNNDLTAHELSDNVQLSPVSDRDPVQPSQISDQEAEPINETKKTPQQQTKEQTALPLHVLWDKGYNLAMKIARSLELDTDCVMPAKCGMGYYIDIPKISLLVPTDDNTTGHTIQSLGWWTLLAISEQVKDTATVRMWEHTELYKWLCDKNSPLGSMLGRDPTIAVNLHKLLQSLLISDQAFTDFFRLMENCRNIKKNHPDERIWNQ